jgi:hypothetical protein
MVVVLISLALVLTTKRWGPEQITVKHLEFVAAILLMLILQDFALARAS